MPLDVAEDVLCSGQRFRRGGAGIHPLARLQGGDSARRGGEPVSYTHLEGYKRQGLYSSLRVKGKLVLTPQAKQPFELNADSVEILGDCPADEYPCLLYTSRCV